MSDETLELEPATVVPVVDQEPTEDELTNFDASKYGFVYSRLSEASQEKIAALFATKEYGWKYRARAVLNIASLQARVDTNVAELEDSFSERVITPEDKARRGMRVYISSLDESTLASLAARYFIVTEGISKEAIVEAVVTAILAQAV